MADLSDNLEDLDPARCGSTHHKAGCVALWIAPGPQGSIVPGAFTDLQWHTHAKTSTAHTKTLDRGGKSITTERCSRIYDFVILMWEPKCQVLGMLGACACPLALRKLGAENFNETIMTLLFKWMAVICGGCFCQNRP